MGNEHCGCGEEHDHTHILTEGYVTLTLEDDEEVECSIITTYELDSREYVVLLPLDENGENEDGNVWIYRFIRDTSGQENHEIECIEDDEEYEAAADRFDEWLDEQEFQDLVDEPVE